MCWLSPTVLWQLPLVTFIFHTDDWHHVFDSTKMSVCALALLIPDFSVYSEQWGTAHAYQSYQKCEPVILPILAGIAIAGSLIPRATAMDVSQGQYSQLSAHISGEFTKIQSSVAMLSDQVDPGCSYPPGSKNLKSFDSPGLRYLHFPRRGVLLQCQRVRNSEKTPVNSVNASSAGSQILWEAFLMRISWFPPFMDRGHHLDLGCYFGNSFCSFLCDPYPNMLLD